MKPLYGHQEGAVVSYDPHKRGRPSHSYHSYLPANPRQVAAAEVAPGIPRPDYGSCWIAWRPNCGRG